MPPLIESGGLTNKPLSIALEEIAEGKIDYERPEEPADE
ncbi:MAG: DNA-directed RNA polymerase subunit omega [Actinomycetota bacterium]